MKEFVNDDERPSYTFTHERKKGTASEIMLYIGKNKTAEMFDMEPLLSLTRNRSCAPGGKYEMISPRKNKL